jgi:hypothetical protein
MLAIAAVVPAVASAQAAGDEYGQASLPSGGNGDTNPSNVTPAAGDDSDSSGGTSVLLVGLAAVAAVCAGFAAWRLRGGGGDDDDERGPQQRVAPSAGSSETS